MYYIKEKTMATAKKSSVKMCPSKATVSQKNRSSIALSDSKKEARKFANKLKDKKIKVPVIFENTEQKKEDPVNNLSEIQSAPSTVLIVNDIFYCL